MDVVGDMGANLVQGEGGHGVVDRIACPTVWKSLHIQTLPWTSCVAFNVTKAFCLPVLLLS